MVACNIGYTENMPKTGETHWAGSVAQKAIIKKDGKFLYSEALCIQNGICPAED